MRAWLLACAALGATPTLHSQEANDVDGIIPFPTTTRTLANGLEVIVMPMPSSGLVAYWSIVRTGSRDEYEPGRSGFAHFFEHMMFRGTERYPAELYQQKLAAMGADANAYTTDDLTAYHISMTAADLEQVLDLESDRFQNLAYAETAFQTEAGAVYGEYRKSRTDPEFTLYESLMATRVREAHLRPHHDRLRERHRGDADDVRLLAQFLPALLPAREHGALHRGRRRPESVLPLVERYYGGWKRGYVTPEVPTEPEQKAERRVNVAYDGQTLPMLWIAYKVPAFAPADRTRVAVELLAELAFGETSETYRRLVLEEQVVEFLDTNVDEHRDPGLLDITTRVKDPAKVDYVLGVIDAAIASVRAAPPDGARLADLQRRLKYGFVMGLQTPDAVAQRLARFIALTGNLDGVRKLYTTYSAVTPEDVQRAATQYLDDARRTVGVLRARQ